MYLTRTINCVPDQDNNPFCASPGQCVVCPQDADGGNESNELRRQLEAVQRQAEEYKQQLRAKEEEAEKFRQRLSQIETVAVAGEVEGEVSVSVTVEEAESIQRQLAELGAAAESVDATDS